MEQTLGWRELQDRQDLRVQDCLRDTAEESWVGIRKLVEEATEISRNTTTIWEGPGRAATLPISYQAIRNFIEKHGRQAEEILCEFAYEANPAISGHCLMGLSWCDSPLLPKAAQACTGRSETIFSIHGCFGWEGSLEEYATRLVTEEDEE